MLNTLVRDRKVLPLLVFSPAFGVTPKANENPAQSGT